MRNTAFRVVLLCCVLIFTSTSAAEALSSDKLALTEDPFHYKMSQLTEKEATKKQAPDQEESTEETKAEPEQVATPVPVQYAVVTGDSLSKIAELHQTTWMRLYAKNIQLADPNMVSAGQVITIPLADEQLPERPLPAATPEPSRELAASSKSRIRSVRGNSAGNTYAPGYCTWYAKQRRPDLPNRLGNASSWVSRAAAQGFATGSAPQAGAIGQQGNHVVYVESVNGDGTVTVSEMNYRGLGIVSSRTVSVSSFTYIY